MSVVATLSSWNLVTWVTEYLFQRSLEYIEMSQVSYEAIVVQAPELTCSFRPSRDTSFFVLATFRQTFAPELESEYHALASKVPALEAPMRPSYATEAEWLVADCAYFQTWQAWHQEHPNDWLEAYQRASDRQQQLAALRQQPRKECTVGVGLAERTLQTSPQLLDSLRGAETWRYNPQRRAPLDKALANDRPIARLKEQGRMEEAAAVEASTRRLVEHISSWPDAVQQRRQARSSWGQKALWIDRTQSHDDVRFLLVVYLLQERIVECTAEIVDFLQQYLGQFRHFPGWEEGGSEVFMRIVMAYALPEHWKGLRRYLVRTLTGHWRTTTKREVELRGPELVVPSRDDGLYSIDNAVHLLLRETKGQWTPPRDWFYDRILEGVLPVVYDAESRKCLDENGLQYARKLVQDENQRRALVTYQMDMLGKSRRAANKFIQEHKACGESLDDIANVLLAQRRGSHT